MFKIACIFRYFLHLQISKILSLNMFYLLSYNSLNMCYFTCKICKFQYQTSARARSLTLKIFTCKVKYSLTVLLMFAILCNVLLVLAFIPIPINDVCYPHKRLSSCDLSLIVCCTVAQTRQANLIFHFCIFRFLIFRSLIFRSLIFRSLIFRSLIFKFLIFVLN